MIKIKGGKVSGGHTGGEAIVSMMPISFTGGLDPSTGIVRETGHDLEEMNVAGKILVFFTEKGSATGSWQFYAAWRRDNAPKGMICVKADGIVAVSAIITHILLIHKRETNPLEIIKTGDLVLINADEGFIEIKKNQSLALS